MFLGVAVEPAVGRPGPVVPDVLGPTDTEAIARVESFMEEQEPFLDPSLTIRSLARRLGMGQRELSCLINQQLGVHFFDFVNRYRVEKAAAVLIDPRSEEHTSELQSLMRISYAVFCLTKTTQ